MRASSYAPRPGSRLLAAALLAATLSGAGLLAQATAAHAQAQPAAAQPSAALLALATQLVEVNGEARAFDGVIPNLVDGAALSFLRTNPDLSKQLREAALAVRPEFEKRKPEIVRILAAVYAARFTEQELKDAIAFFSSPVGKKLVNDRAVIVQEAVQAIQAWGAQANAQAVERIRQEMKKKGVDL